MMTGRSLICSMLLVLVLTTIRGRADRAHFRPGVWQPPREVAIGAGGLDGIRLGMEAGILDSTGAMVGKARVFRVRDRESFARLLDSDVGVGRAETLKVCFRDSLVRSGRIVIQASTRPDEVWVDGTYRGGATALYLGIGHHKLRITKLGHEPWGRRFELGEGQILEIPVELSPVPRERRLVRVPSGTFGMGVGALLRDERPVHSVTVGSFLMRCCEVTCEEYWEFDPSHRNRTRGKALHPADNLNWWDAASFSNWLSRREGLEVFYDDNDLKRRAVSVDMNWDANGYRLPTEAEWEYACRAGSQTAYYWGDRMDDRYCWHAGNAGRMTHAAGALLPNAFGLWDMLGNVAEWCNDWYDEDFYQESPQAGPRGPALGTHRVIRGGSWSFDAHGCRCSDRFFLRPTDKFEDLGFRLVRPTPAAADEGVGNGS